MNYKELTTKAKIKFWKRALKRRQERLERSQTRKKQLRQLIKKANSRIARIKTELSLVSDQGVEFVAYWEGFPNQGKPYNDPVGHCTVGYGHLLHRGNCTPDSSKAVWIEGQKTPGVLTKEEGKRLLKKDLTYFALGVKEKTLLWHKLTTNERDALVSFAFNVGLGAYGDSTLLKKLNRGDMPGAANEFLRWVYADGQKLPGLERRRKAEREMFLGV